MSERSSLRSLRLSCACAALTLSLPLAARAAVDGPATAAVRRANERVTAALESWERSPQAGKAKARERAREAVTELLDFPAFAKATMGAHWEQLSEAQRERYTAALRGAMEANYLVKMAEHGSVDVHSVRVDYLGEDTHSDGKKVRTVLHRGKDEVQVDYICARGSRGWRAVDLITEGTSTLETYRDSIEALYPKKGFDGVVSAFEKKRKSLETKLDALAAKAAGHAAEAPAAGGAHAR